MGFVDQQHRDAIIDAIVLATRRDRAYPTKTRSRISLQRTPSRVASTP